MLGGISLLLDVHGTWCCIAIPFLDLLFIVLHRPGSGRARRATGRGGYPATCSSQNKHGSTDYVCAGQVPEDSIEAITDLPRLDSIGSADTDDVKVLPHLSVIRQHRDSR